MSLSERDPLQNYCQRKTSRVLNSVSTGILVRMLKKEKARARDAAAQLVNVVNGQSPVSQKGWKLPSTPLLKEGSTDDISANPGGRAIQYMKRGRSFILHVLV